MKKGRFKSCVQCGTQFWCTPSRDIGGKHDLHSYCSRACGFASKRLNPEKHAAAFWARVDKDGPGGCWIYTGAKAAHGYGYVQTRWYKSKFQTAHRYAWMLTNGEPPEGMQVLHRCDNRPCCNPEHLFLGTIKDNMQDMLRKGRNGNCYLNPDQVREIRVALKSPYHGLQRELERKYGVPRGVVSKIARGLTYLHVK